VSIIGSDGSTIKTLASLPSGETSPSGADNVQNIPRSFQWRDDVPATVAWCEPLDSGLIKKEQAFHDAVYALSAPFTGQPTELFKTALRFGRITWGTDSVALVVEGLRARQLIRLNWYSPATKKLEKLLDRNTTDAYNDPGDPVTAKNKYGRLVIKPVDNGTKILMNNLSGSSPEGDRPFLAKLDLRTRLFCKCKSGAGCGQAGSAHPQRIANGGARLLH
jgi:hypothetical protein